MEEKNKLLKEEFNKQIIEEYEYFNKKTLKLQPKEISDKSLQITFYREVFTYLKNADLSDNDLVYFKEEKIINKMWETYLISNLSKSPDYLRQLLSLIRKNNQQKQYELLLSKIKNGS